MFVKSIVHVSIEGICCLGKDEDIFAFGHNSMFEVLRHSDRPVDEKLANRFDCCGQTLGHFCE